MTLGLFEGSTIQKKNCDETERRKRRKLNFEIKESRHP